MPSNIPLSPNRSSSVPNLQLNRPPAALKAVSSTPSVETVQPTQSPSSSMATRPRVSNLPAPLGSPQDAEQIQQQVQQLPDAQLQANAIRLSRSASVGLASKSLFAGQRNPHAGLESALVTSGNNFLRGKNQLEQGPRIVARADTDTSKNQIDGMAAVLPTRSGVVGRGAIYASNLGDSGVSMMLSGGLSLSKTASKLDDGRLFQIRARGGDIALGVSGEGAPVFGRVGIGGSYDVAYARMPREHEQNLSPTEFSLSPPPSRSDVAADPEKALATGDEVAYRGSFRAGATIGGWDPHSGIKVAVSASLEREFISSVRRLPDLEGKPVYRLRIEPANHRFDANLSVGLGPFAVATGGGKSSSVYYEFEIGSQQLKAYLDKDSLPVTLPEPQKYFGKGPEAYAEAFEQQNQLAEGIKLLGMGATESSERYQRATTGVATIKRGLTRSETVHIRPDELIHQDLETLSSGHSAWFSGELSNTLGLTLTQRYSTPEDVPEPGFEEFMLEKPKVEQAFVSLEASFKITDTKTDGGDFDQRIRHFNDLLGRQQPLLTKPDQRASWGHTELALQAEVRPEHLTRLAALGSGLNPERDPDQFSSLNPLRFMETTHGVSSIQTEQMLIDLHKLEQDATLKPQQKLHLQGVRVAAYLAGGDKGAFGGTVGDPEFKRLVTLDRLLEHDLIQVKSSSDVYAKKLRAFAVDSFISDKAEVRRADIRQTANLNGSALHDVKARLSSDPWNRFNVAAQKIRGLEGLRAEVAGDDNRSLIQPQEKTRLLADIDSALTSLNQVMDQQLESPDSRRKVMQGLMKAGSPGLVPQTLYNSPEKMYDSPQKKNELLDRVVDNMLKKPDRDEVKDFIDFVCSNDQGQAGIPPLLKLMHHLDRDESNILAQVLQEMPIAQLAQLNGRLSRSERSELLHLIDTNKYENQGYTPDPNVEGSLFYTTSDPSKSPMARLDDFEKGLDWLETEQGILRGNATGTKRDKSELPWLEHFKDEYKHIHRPLAGFVDEIRKEKTPLDSQDRKQILERAEALQARAAKLTNGIASMNEWQRAELFRQVLNQDLLGEVSQDILKRLITSATRKELSLYAVAIEPKLKASVAGAGVAIKEKLTSSLSRNHLKISGVTRREMQDELSERLKEIQNRLKTL